MIEHITNFLNKKFNDEHLATKDLACALQTCVNFCKINRISLRLGTLNFSNKVLGNLDLTAADMQGCNMTNTTIINTNMTNADLREVDFKDTQFYKTTMDGADLRGAKNFPGLEGIIGLPAYMPDGSKPAPSFNLSNSNSKSIKDFSKLFNLAKSTSPNLPYSK